MGRIHPDADEIHFSRNPDHREIVRPFLSAFDVTRGFWKTRGTDRLACFYLKPEPFIAELVGLERELFLAYAPFSEVQARTIKLHDEVLAEDRTRLDPLGSILITDDPNTTKATETFVSSDPERPPVIAISRYDLVEIRDANGVRALLFSGLFQRDLFALESPLRTDTTFFGRDEITSHLLDRFRTGQNTGLFGLRRIGKTSVLYAVRRRAEAGELAGTAYLDVSSPAVYKSRWWELLQTIARAFAEPLSLERSARSKIRALTISYSEADAATHFKADIQNLAPNYPKSRLFILLDEVEHITFQIGPVAHWTEDFLPFWQTLRSVHQDTEGRFGFVVAGVNPHILETDRVGRFDNPLFSTVRPFYLGPFDLLTTRAMVRRISKYLGLRVEEPLYQKLLDEYGGHPFFIRQACSHLARQVTNRPGDLTVSSFEREHKAIAIALDRSVRQVLNVLAIWYPEEYELIRILALGDKKTFREFADLSATFTQHVEGYGLVQDARTDPKLLIGLVRDHLVRVPRSAAKQEASASDRDGILAEISRRRNAVELSLRRVLHNGLRFGKGPKAADAALSALPSDRRAVLAQFSYDQLWDHLYFNELASILKAHWQHFATFFSEDLDKIMLWLDQVNRCRVDAHARQLSEEDLAFLRVCFRRLEEVLSVA